MIKVNEEYEKVKEEIKAALGGFEFIAREDFEGFRVDNSKTQEQWPEGFIDQAAVDLGIEVYE